MITKHDKSQTYTYADALAIAQGYNDLLDKDDPSEKWVVYNVGVGPLIGVCDRGPEKGIWFTNNCIIAGDSFIEPVTKAQLEDPSLWSVNFVDWSNW